MKVVIGPYQTIEYRRDGQLVPRIGLWRGEDLRTGEEVSLTVLAPAMLDGARNELAVAAAVTHPHLLMVVDVVEQNPDDQAVLVAPWPAGGLLADVIARRGRLSVGETLTVLIPLADAVATAHRANLRHGGICPEDVWFDGIGRPLLGPLGVSRVVVARNRGFPAGSRDLAPETVRGEAVRRGPVTLAADVFSLGSVALACLTGRSAWPADEPADVLVQSAAGLWPDLPDDAAPPGLIALIRDMLSSAPESRPTATDVAARLAGIGVPQPVQFAEQSGSISERPRVSQPRHLSAVPESGSAPSDEPVDDDRSFDDDSFGSRSFGVGDLSVQDDSSPTITSSSAPTSPAPGSTAGRPTESVEQLAPRSDSVPTNRQASAPASGPGTISRLIARIPRTRPFRVGRGSGLPSGQPGPGSAQAELRDLLRSGLVGPVTATGAGNLAVGGLGRLTPLARTGLILLTGVLVTLVALQVSMWWDDGSEPAGSATSGAVGVTGVSTDWAAVVHDLDSARGRALAAADPTLLAAVYGEGTPELQADTRTIQQLADQGLRVVDGVHQVVSVTVVNSAPTESAPTESAPTESAPTESAPTESAPTESAPTESAPTESAPPSLAPTSQALVTADLPGSTPAVPGSMSGPISAATSAPTGFETVRLAVVDTLPAHPIVDVGGQQVGITQARAEQRRVLVLVRTEQGYRIIGVEPG